jgi:plastocyanin
MPANVSAPTRGTLGRLLAAACVVAFGVACSTLPSPQVQFPEGRAFVTMVPDSVDDVGLHPSIAVDGEGFPYISYFGFTARLSPDEIPVSRPIGSPYLDTEEGDPAAAVLLTSLIPDSQAWNRGAVAQPRETPTGVTVPFGPAAEPSLRSLTPSTAVGTDVAVSGADIHVVWAADSGVWYGLGPDFEIEPIEKGAGIGAPSIALGDDGAPIVAYTVAGPRPEVKVAERTGESWTTTTVATLSQCGRECPPATSVGIVGGEPIVAVADPSSRELLAARRSGGSWSTEVIASGVTGGVSLAASGDTAVVSYYTPDGVAVANGGAAGGWSTEEVASVTPRAEASPTASPSPTTGASPSPAEGASPSAEPEEPIRTEPTTGIAIDGKGRTWVAWEDAEGIHVASSGEEGGFQEQDLGRTEGGVTPSVAVTEDGATAYVAWFDPENANLMLSISAERDEVVLAALSPTPQPPEPTTDEGCGEEGGFVLDVVAVNTTFDPTCMVAPAGEPFTVTFENQDDGIPHNWEFMPEPGGEVIAQTEPKPGTYTDTLDVEPQDAGSYYFQCVVHPDVMNGTLAVVEGGGGQGGGGGGNGGGGGGGNGGVGGDGGG